MRNVPAYMLVWSPRLMMTNNNRQTLICIQPGVVYVGQ